MFSYEEIEVEYLSKFSFHLQTHWEIQPSNLPNNSSEKPASTQQLFNT